MAPPRREEPQPYLIHHPDGSPLAFAGLWSAWKDDANDAWLHSCTIITTAANEAMAALHDRMPVVLPHDTWDRWLDPTVTDPELLRAFLHASAAGELEAYPVSTAVNSHEQGPELARLDRGPVLPRERGTRRGGTRRRAARLSRHELLARDLRRRPDPAPAAGTVTPRPTWPSWGPA